MIHTARLLLRPARPEDLQDLHEIFSDPRAMRYWDGPPHKEIADTQDFLDWFIHSDWNSREEYILQYEGRCVGKAGCWHTPEIGYILHPRLWRKGLMFEALSALLPRIFTRFPGEPALTAEVDPRNRGSVALLTRLGFVQTRYGVLDHDYGGLMMCDTAYFELPRTDR